MSTRLKKFITLDGRRRKYLLQAFIGLGRARWALSRNAFKDLVSNLECNTGERRQGALATGQEEIARDIGWAVRTAAAHAPWTSSCLVQVLAAQRMLRSIYRPFPSPAKRGRPKPDRARPSMPGLSPTFQRTTPGTRWSWRWSTPEMPRKQPAPSPSVLRYRCNGWAVSDGVERQPKRA